MSYSNCTSKWADMAKTERLNIRTTEILKEKIMKVAIRRGVTISEMINDYIKSLPNPKD